MAAKVTFNYNLLLKQVANSRPVLNQVNKIAKNQFETEKAKMINKFLNHPVTQEIAAGPDATNTSNTLKIANNDHGNLYSFLGFDTSDPEPVDTALRVINENTRFFRALEGKVSGKRLTFNYTVKVPNTTQINEGTPLPWLSGRSWILALENGVANLSAYLFRRGFDFGPVSRSGPAIQIKGKQLAGMIKVRATSPVRVKSYLSNMLQEFLAKFKSRTV